MNKISKINKENKYSLDALWYSSKHLVISLYVLLQFPKRLNFLEAFYHLL